MLNKHKIIFATIFVLFLFSGAGLYAQKRISIEAENKALSSLLNSVGRDHSIRFAFDEDLLSQIDVSIEEEDISIEQFLDTISNQYGLSYRLIAGTYVFYVDDEEKINDAISQTVARKAEQHNVSVDEPEKRVYEVAISGFVQNLNTGEKIRFCRVIIDDKHLVMTNEMGYFQRTIETEGEVKFQIRQLGYLPFDTTLVLHQSTELEFGIVPIPLLDRMSSRMVAPLKFMFEIPDMPEMIAYSPQNVFQIPGAESNDLVNALTLIPGINYLKGIDAGLSIRGGAPSDNLVLIDGIPIIESSHLMGNLSNLNAKFIQQAFVSRGGFGAEYGGRTSGIVDLTGKAGSDEKTVVDFTANMLHTNIYIGVPVTEKSSLSGSFRKSFVDVWPGYHINNFEFENQMFQVDGSEEKTAEIESTEINYSDLNIKFTLRPSNTHEFNFNIFNSSDRQKRNYVFPIEDDYYQQNQSRSEALGFSTNLKMQSLAGWLNTFSAGYNQMNSSSVSENGKSQQIVDQPVKAYFDSDLVSVREIRAAWNSELKRRFISQKFGVGYNSHFIDYKYENHEVKIPGANNFNDSISSNASIDLMNLYYQADLSPVEWLKFRAGIRGLYDINKGLLHSQPRYGVEILPSKYLRFNYSAGRYMQHMYLTYRINSYNNASSMWFIPEHKNQNLDAFHHIVGSRLEYKNILMNIEAYQKKNMNKIFFLGSIVDVGGISPIVSYEHRVGEELNRGLDFLFQWRGKYFKHMASYSLSESFERIDGVNNGNYFNSFDHQLHRLRITEVVRWNDWTASFNWYYANGMPHLKHTSTISTFDFETMPDFMQLDVSLVKQFDFNYFFADIGVTVLNVFNRINYISIKNTTIPEGNNVHNIKNTTIATSFSPLFYINLRYE
jgi:hypothetical protein